MIYCALIDADFYEHEGNLFLRFKEIYCYETLRLNNYALLLYTIFQDNKNFNNIVLRYGGKDFYCPKPLPKLSSSQTFIKSST